jgi:hypothetical protein
MGPGGAGTSSALPQHDGEPGGTVVELVEALTMVMQAETTVLNCWRS